MPKQPPSTTRTPPPWTRRSPPNPPPSSNDGDIRPLLWTLFITKLVIVIIVAWISRSITAAMLLGLTTWFWIVVALALTGGWLLFRYRLLRVRAKRDQLRQAEWAEPSGTISARDPASYPDL